MSSIPSDDIFSILICSRDRRENLENLVVLLQGFQCTSPFEIIVVEETNNPASIDGVIYISHPISNKGIPYARNLALAEAKGHIIIFLDDDCTILDGWLENLLEPFKDESVVGVQGGVTVPHPTNAVGWAETILGFPGGGIHRVIKTRGKIRETREISTLNCAYRKWVIDKVGGFDEKLFLGGEDYLLAKQACQYGRCLFVPNAMVSHQTRGNLRNIWHWFVRRGLAEIALIRTGKQNYTTFWTVCKSSLTLKSCLLILGGLIFPKSFLFLFILALFVYGVLQWGRYHSIWKLSRAPRLSLALLPVVKFTMDIAMDWGRFRGIIAN